MANKINYTGSSKVIKRICEAVNDLIDNGGGGGGGSGISSTTYTLLASGWTQNSAPFQYDLGSLYSEDSILIGYDADSQSATNENYLAAVNAKIVGGEGTIIYAYGTKPTVNIPIIIIYG